MEMTNEEILRSWRQALDRTKQIQVLAELNLCGRSRIVEILIEGGVDPHELPSVPKYQRGSCYNPAKKEEAPGTSRRWIWNPNRTKTAAPPDSGSNATTPAKTARQNAADQKLANDLGFVRAALPPCELWAQLAEDASELAHAALKIRRSTGGVNPTPVEPSTAFDSVMEKVADVMLLLHVLQLDTSHDAIEKAGRRKLRRWRDRLEERMAEREEAEQ